MKTIKIIFESVEPDEETRFGYIIEKDSLSYKTAKFDKRLEPFEIVEAGTISDVTEFGKKMWRIIRAALV